MEEARKKEHLSEVNQRQELAEQQIAKLEAELAEEQKKKEELVRPIGEVMLQRSLICLTSLPACEMCELRTSNHNQVSVPECYRFLK